jgi:hypothetical protein
MAIFNSPQKGEKNSLQFFLQSLGSFYLGKLQVASKNLLVETDESLDKSFSSTTDQAPALKLQENACRFS